MDLKLRRICSIGALMAAAALVLAPSKMTGAPDNNVEFVELFKLVDRSDGTPVSNPYEFEACVEGSGVTGATITVPGSGTPLPLQDEGDGDYCYLEHFASAVALDTAFPNGMYTFNISIPGGSDSKTVSFTASEPEAWLDVTAPVDGATGVPHDSDLDVTWDLARKPACPVGDCSDGIEFFLIDDALDQDVFEEPELSSDATGVTVPASILQPGTLYEIEVGTYNGLVDPSATTDLGDAIDLIAIWEDINVTSFTTVPEPAAALLQISALATLGWLVGRRRNLR